MAENNSDNSSVSETPKEPEAEASEGHTVVGIRFRPCGRIYTFEIGDIDVSRGTKVVVESEMGLSLGSVALPRHTIENPKEPLKKVIRVATEEDFETVRNNQVLEEEAKAFCVEKAKEYNLQMKVVTTESTLDRKRLIFYFTADGRIDFRALVRDLAARFKTRIEMRQIGVRDEVKMLGGIGVCGRQTCCSQFLTSFEPITIRMAKEQELSINQSKLSGICGRLMCCLGYEYRDADDEKTGDSAPDGENAAAGDDIQAGDMDKITTEDTVEQDSAALVGVAAGEEKKTDASAQPEQGAGKQRPRRRKRRRRKKNPAAATGERQPREQPEPSAAEPREGEETDGNPQRDKGRPFSKRRRFWKKKKH
ncbi:MAG: stage 0 sporulation family protein [Deferribacteres bacterium]|nr:stage 0 sporulation family protein [Deferribacteres bacterium]